MNQIDLKGYIKRLIKTDPDRALRLAGDMWAGAAFAYSIDAKTRPAKALKSGAAMMFWHGQWRIASRAVRRITVARGLSS